MRRLESALLLALLMFCLGAGSAAARTSQEEASVAALVALSKAGLGDDLLIRHRRSTGTGRRRARREIGKGRKAGFSAEVGAALEEASRAEGAAGGSDPGGSSTGTTAADILLSREKEKIEKARRRFWQTSLATSDEVGTELVEREHPHVNFILTRENEDDEESVEAARGLFSKLERIFGKHAFDEVRGEHVRVVILDTEEEYLRMLEAKVAARLWLDEQAKLLAHPGARGGSRYHPKFGTAAICCRERSGDTLINGVLHFVGHSVVRRLLGEREAPNWLQEGFASYCEALQAGFASSFCVSYEMPDAADLENWKRAVYKAVRSGKARPLETLSRTFLIDMKMPDFYQSRSVVSYLIEQSPRRFLRFLSEMRAGAKQGEALKKAYDLDFEALEEEWREYVLQTHGGG